MFKFAYGVISKINGCCVQTIRTGNGSWKLDNEQHYSLSIDPVFAPEYLGKYYMNNKWYERIWNRYETIVEKDEEGNVIFEETVPVEEYGYTDKEWKPGA